MLWDGIGMGVLGKVEIGGCDWAAGERGDGVVADM